MMKMNNIRASKREGSLPSWVIWAVAIAFGLATIASGVLVFRTVQNLVGKWTGIGINPFGFSASADETSLPESDVTPTAVILDETLELWNGSDRVTILFMGLDYRDWLSGDGPPRTDTMMLVTVDPITRTAGMLSIPRDLWVEIPGYPQHNRINTAYFLGESERLPGGGPGLAMKTVENLIGVPVQYYAVVDFSVFERVIDEIGGIDVLAKERIKISPIGEMSKWLEAKAYHLNGAEALAYARARKTEGGDFDRAQRQQQVVMAIRDRVTGFDMIPMLIAKAPKLYQEISGGIRTNLSLEDMISLGMLALDIDMGNIKRGVIAPPEMVLLETLPDGAQVLKPVPDKIRLLRDEIFTSTGAIGPSLDIDNPAEAAKQEDAKLAVRNGAGIEGLAGTTADYLRNQGLNVVEVGNADRMDYLKTVVIDYTGNPYTRSYLKNLMNLTEGQILSQIIPDSDIDVAVIVGSDFYPPNQ